MESEKNICKKCGRCYNRKYCEFCKREENFDLDYNLKYFPPRFQRDLLNMDIKVHNEEINCLLNGDSILIVGVAGSGKTLYGCKLMLEMIKKSYVEHVGPSEFKIITTVNLLDEIRKSYDQENEIDLSIYFNKSSLIFLDDLGAHKTTDWALEKLNQIINYRYEYLLPTIFTTNFDSQKLIELLDSRIISRINQMCIIKKMENKDYRING